MWVMKRAVRRKPYSVVLMDEVEKAHPDVFNILLQVLEDGRLTDGQGRTVDFKNTVVVMTSNLGSDRIQDIASNKTFDVLNMDGSVDENTENEHRYQAMKDSVMEVVAQHFRPEFINRVDEVVVFHPLAKAQIRGIAAIQMALLQGRLAERELVLELGDVVMDKIAEAGFDPVYGARPLKRTITTLIENPLAQDVLAGKFAPGDTIGTQLSEGKVVFEKR